MRSYIVNITTCQTSQVIVYLNDKFKDLDDSRSGSVYDLAKSDSTYDRVVVCHDDMADNKKAALSKIIRATGHKGLITFIEIYPIDELDEAQRDKRSTIVYNIPINATEYKSITDNIMTLTKGSEICLPGNLVGGFNRGWETYIRSNLIRKDIKIVKPNTKQVKQANELMNKKTIKHNMACTTMTKVEEGAPNISKDVSYISRVLVATIKGAKTISAVVQDSELSDSALSASFLTYDPSAVMGKIIRFGGVNWFNIGKIWTFSTGLYLAYSMWKLFEIKVMSKSDAMGVIIDMAKFLLNKFGGKAVVKDNKDPVNYGLAWLIVELEKKNIAAALQQGQREADEQANKIKNDLFLQIILAMSFTWLTSGRLLFSAVMLGCGLIASSASRLPAATMAAISLSNLPILMKPLAVAAIAVYELRIPKINNVLKWVVPPLIATTSLAGGIGKMNKQWQELDDEYYSDKEGYYTIDDYWKVLGLQNYTNSGVRYRAREPEKERTGQVLEDYLDAHKLFSTKPNIVMDAEKQYRHSVHRDDMLVKAIHKRLSGERPKIDQRYMQRFHDHLVGRYSVLPISDISEEEAIRKVMTTKGTAGEFAKHTVYETIWKDVNEPKMISFWEAIVDKIRTAVIMNKSNYEINQYRLYEKVESIPVEKDNTDKVIRLIQAPNLTLRIADARPLHYLNESIVASRRCMPPQIGINMFIEMRFICWVPRSASCFTADMSSFDKLQHPYQIIACRDARVRQLANNYMPIEDITYITHRYDIQIIRRVESSRNISLVTIGEQASGDTTTSDDNSMRNATFMELMIEEAIEEHKKEGKQITKYEVHTAGDDSKIIIFGDVNDDIIIRVTQKHAKMAGWITREEQIIRGPSWATFLSHTVKTVKMRTKTGQTVYMDMIWRERIRPVAKLIYSGDIRGKINSKRGRSIITSKAVSFIISYFARVDIFILASYIILKATSKEIQFEGDISWSLRGAFNDMNFGFKSSDLMSIHAQIPLKVDMVSVEEEIREDVKDIKRWLLERGKEDKDANRLLKIFDEKQLKLNYALRKLTVWANKNYINNTGDKEGITWIRNKMKNNRDSQKNNTGNHYYTAMCICKRINYLDKRDFTKKIEEDKETDLLIICKDHAEQFREVNRDNRKRYIIKETLET